MEITVYASLKLEVILLPLQFWGYRHMARYSDL